MSDDTKSAEDQWGQPGEAGRPHDEPTSQCDAATAAFDAIAKICGCAQWDYPGQIVRDVLALATERDRLRQELCSAAERIDQVEGQLLADAVHRCTCPPPPSTPGDNAPRIDSTAPRAEIEQLSAEVASLEATVPRQSQILTGVAAALRGTPPPLTLWSHHDLAERASVIVAQLRALQPTTPQPAPACTGVSAGWCPNCGDCTCPQPELARDSDNCPLHGRSSKHTPEPNDGAWILEMARREEELSASQSGGLGGLGAQKRRTETVPETASAFDLTTSMTDVASVLLQLETWLVVALSTRDADRTTAWARQFGPILIEFAKSEHRRVVALERDNERLTRACVEGLPREIMYCPKCSAQHIEGPRHDDPSLDGRVRPHHHHRCYACGHDWPTERWSYGDTEARVAVPIQIHRDLAERAEVLQRELDEARSTEAAREGEAQRMVAALEGLQKRIGTWEHQLRTAMAWGRVSAEAIAGLGIDTGRKCPCDDCNANPGEP